MGLNNILAQIDREINKLKQARAVLEGTVNYAPKKRNLTPEGRRRIAEAVKRRWALEKKNKLDEATAAWVTDQPPPSSLAYQASQI